MPQAPTKLLISPVGLTDQPKPFDGELSCTVFALPPDDCLELPENLEYQLNVQRLHHELLITGKLGMEARFRCSKCAEFFSTTVVDSDFVHHFPLASDSDEVDLTDDVREALLLCFPTFPLCSHTCRGLCPHCGGNRNVHPCTCQAPQADDRWSGLDQLNISTSEEEESG